MNSTLIRPPERSPASAPEKAPPGYFAGKRDLRLDFLRGFAIFAMVVDHVGGDSSWLYPVTGGNRFYVSAAEAFLLLSGLVTGMVYTAVAARQGLSTAIMKILKRASVLYAWTVGLTLALPLAAAKLGLDWENPFADTSPASYIVSVLTLHRTYHLVDILLIYVLLFSLAPVALTLITEGRWAIVLGITWGIWAVWQRWPEYAQVPWSIEGMDTFNLAAWQALFFTGLVMGAHRRAVSAYLSRIPRRLYLIAGGAGLALALLLYRADAQPLTNLLPQADAQTVLDDLFAKADLRIGRLLVFAFVGAFAFSLVTLAWDKVQAWLGWLFIPLGQHSLTAYALHVGVVAGISKAALVLFGDEGPSMHQNTLLQLTAVTVVWSLVHLVAMLQNARTHGRAIGIRAPAVGWLREPRPAPVQLPVSRSRSIRDAA